MKTPKSYVLGIDSDRVLTVRKVDGQILITIKVKDTDHKHAKLTPQRFVFFPLRFVSFRKLAFAIAYLLIYLVTYLKCLRFISDGRHCVK